MAVSCMPAGGVLPVSFQLKGLGFFLDEVCVCVGGDGGCLCIELAPGSLGSSGKARLREAGMD